MFTIEELKCATALVIKDENGDEFYIEEQEHCSLCADAKGNWIGPGQYYINPETNETEFIFWDNWRNPLEGKISGKILDLSFDYGTTWWSEIGEK